MVLNRSTKLLVILPVVVSFLFSCGSADNDSNANSGKAIYEKRCVICHGIDGKLGTSGAKDLSVSRIDHNLSRAIISHGKGAMPMFKQVLSEKEITEVIRYIETLRK